MEKIQKCTFCIKPAEPKSQWEIAWSVHCAESLQKLLDLEPFTASFFEAAEYCGNCKGLIRDVDFMSRSVSALERRLAKSRQEIAKMLLDNFEEWTATATDQEMCQARSRSRTTHGSNTVSVTSEHSVALDADLSNTHGHNPSTASAFVTRSEEIPFQSSPIYGDDEIKPPDPDEYVLFGNVGSDHQYSSPPVKDEAIFGNSGDLDFRCHFPGCDKRFGTIHLLERHRRFHNRGRYQRPYKCTASSCSAAFPQMQHLLRHTSKVHPDDLSSHEAANDDDGDYTPREDPTVSDGISACSGPLPSETQGNGGGETAESSSRRSTRLASKPQQQFPIEDESGTEDDVEEDSNFSITSEDNKEDDVDGQEEEDDDGQEESDVTRSNDRSVALKPNRLECKVPRRRDRKRNRYCKLKPQILGRLVPLCLSKSTEVTKEVGKCATNAGNGEFEFPSWESIIGRTLTLHLPEETFQDTFVFLLKLSQEENEKGFSYACPTPGCHRRFLETGASDRHALVIHGKILGSFQCFICDQRAPSVVRLDTHISKVHCGVTHPFPCPVPLCPSQYNFRRKLTHHMATQHPGVEYTEEGERLYKFRGWRRRDPTSNTLYCDEDGCTYRTRYQIYMNAHRIKFHAQADDQDSLPYKCETCGAGYKTLSAYKGHERSAHKNEDEKFVCEFCGRSFAVRNQLSTHIRSQHFDLATKFNCKVCTRPYFSPEDCASHEELHTKVPPFTCVLACGPKMRQYGSAEELVKHVQGFHDEVKKVVCHVCGYSATGPGAKYHLNVHMNVHTKEKTFKCKYCDKPFRRSSEQRTHQEIKHQDQVKKEYKCDECGEVFNVYIYFYRHRRNKHGTNPMPPFKRKKTTE